MELYAELSRKINYSQEIPAPKKVIFLKKELLRGSVYYTTINVLTNYLFWRNNSSEVVTVLKKLLSSKSKWSEKVFVTMK